MENNLILMEFPEHGVTVFGDWQEPLFPAVDIAEKIGIKNRDKVLKILEKLPGDEKFERNNVLMVNEFGVYELLFQSTSRKAREFKTVVKHILRSIRLHGAYMTPDAVNSLKNDRTGDYAASLAENMEDVNTRLQELRVENSGIRKEGTQYCLNNMTLAREYVELYYKNDRSKSKPRKITPNDPHSYVSTPDGQMSVYDAWLNGYYEVEGCPAILSIPNYITQPGESQ